MYCGVTASLPVSREAFGLEQVPIHASRLWGPSVLGFFPRALSRFAREVANYDVVHLNGAWNLTSFIASRIAKHRGVPYILSCRGHYGAYHFQRLRWLKPLLFRLFEIANIRDAWALHMTAKWEVETSFRAVPLAKRIITIPNAVELQGIEELPSQKEALEVLGLDAGRKHIVHMGRLAAQKNLTFLVRAFHQADLAGKVQLHLVGPSESREQQRVDTLIQEYGLQDDVQCVPYVRGVERFIWLRAADLFALPSHDENFCIVLIEAIAVGTPALVSPHVGAVDYVPQEMVYQEPLDCSRWATQLHALMSDMQPKVGPLSLDWTTSCGLDSIGEQWMSAYGDL
jgi:glycosyltransferase involved in cell wall biosynthesis